MIRTLAFLIVAIMMFMPITGFAQNCSKSKTCRETKNDIVEYQGVFIQCVHIRNDINYRMSKNLPIPYYNGKCHPNDWGKIEEYIQKRIKQTHAAPDMEGFFDDNLFRIPFYGHQRNVSCGFVRKDIKKRMKTGKKFPQNYNMLCHTEDKQATQYYLKYKLKDSKKKGSKEKN